MLSGFGPSGVPPIAAHPTDWPGHRTDWGLIGLGTGLIGPVGVDERDYVLRSTVELGREEYRGCLEEVVRSPQLPVSFSNAAIWAASAVDMPARQPGSTSA